MTHQPPVPDASTSPYPLHPAPIAADHANDDVPDRDSGERGEGEAGPNRPSARSRQMLGLGAAVGIGSAAIAAALLYVRRDGAQGDARHNGGDDKGKR